MREASQKFIRAKGEPARFKRYLYGPGGSRLITSLLGVVVGLAIALDGVVDLARGGNSVWLMLCGLGVATLGVGAFFFALWMAKRNL